MTVTERSIILRHPERSVPDEFAAFMTTGFVAHVGFCMDGQPYVIPLAYHFSPAEPSRVYLHASNQSRMAEVLASGTPIAVCVTQVDGLVYSRTAMNHSMNYRSAVCFGRGREITDVETKRQVFQAMTGRYFSGRTAGVHYEPATDAQLDTTTLVALEIEEGSAKTRRGGPNGPTDNDPTAAGTCGVVQRST